VLLGDAANAKSIELLVHFSSELPSAVRGDPTRLRQILLNLASNAVKFTSEGEVVIRARKVEESDDRVRVRFEVTDTGVGIDGDVLTRLFEPFSQADSSTTRRFGGTGLGLAIVNQLVELMRGTIGAESTPGSGSTFWFEVPLAKQDGAILARATVDELTMLRTLIVDDNATNRLILREQLGSWGMISEDVDHAERALEVMREAAAAGRPFDVVVLDLNMPDVDGLQLAHEIHTDAALRHARLFLLSSSGRVAADDAAAAGLTATLTKPVRSSELFNCLVGGLTMTPVTPPEPAAPTSATPVVNGRGHLLLVEDNSINQLVATRMLAKLGYEVDVAENGLQAVEATERVAYDGVLMDCQMPEMDGYQATAAIRRREGDARHTPIIAMTAAAMEGDRDVCLAAGMDDYIAKPVRADTLVEVLERWVVPADREPAAAEPAEPEPAALDAERFDVMRELDGGNGELLRLLATEFLSDARNQVGALREATAEDDPESVERAAHCLKGASSAIGAAGLSELCAQLEVLGRGRALSDAPDLLGRIDHELERVRAALDEVVVGS
jgi:CheY-like chemotaxis protein/HPt (histidine-containing phosphotransfer) domain-containing protein